MDITIPELNLPADVPALNNKQFVEACNWLTRAYQNERTQLNEYTATKNNTRVNQQKMFLVSVGKYLHEIHWEVSTKMLDYQNRIDFLEKLLIMSTICKGNPYTLQMYITSPTLLESDLQLIRQLQAFK